MRTSHGTTCSIYRGFIWVLARERRDIEAFTTLLTQSKGSHPATGEFPQNGLAIHNLMLWWIGWWRHSWVWGRLGCLNAHINSLWCWLKRCILWEARHKLFGRHTCIGGTGPTARLVVFNALYKYACIAYIDQILCSIFDKDSLIAFSLAKVFALVCPMPGKNDWFLFVFF